MQLGRRLQRLSQHLLQRLVKETLVAQEPPAVVDTFSHRYKTSLQLINGKGSKEPSETDVLQVWGVWVGGCLCV